MNVVIEDDLSLAVIKRVLSDTDNRFYIYRVWPDIRRVHSSRGNSYIKRKLTAFNNAAKYMNYLILTDLDRKECAPAYKRELITIKLNEGLIFHIAVREVETWLIADKENFARFLGVSTSLFQIDPESIDDPKQYIFSIVRRSKIRDIRDGVLPLDPTASIGPMYNSLLIKFIENKWDISKAESRSPSFGRLVRKLTKHYGDPIDDECR